MDVFRGGAMNFGFRNGDPGKDRKRVLFHKRRQRTGFKQRLDVLVGTLRRMRV
jgi:hypothetical protein